MKSTLDTVDMHCTTVEPDGYVTCTCGWRSPPILFDRGTTLEAYARWHRLSIGATIDNPLLVAFLDPITATDLKDVGSAWIAHHRRRDRLVAEYAWAIPTEPVIHRLAELSPICDLGCGTGYWARLLQQAGADVIAVDESPPLNAHNHWHQERAGISRQPVTIRHFTEIVRGDAATFDVPSSHALLLCWPPYNDAMAATALARYRGNRVIYVGEDEGCTADEAFHTQIAKNWREIACYEIPQWPGIHDTVHVYERSKKKTSM